MCVNVKTIFIIEKTSLKIVLIEIKFLYAIKSVETL